MLVYDGTKADFLNSVEADEIAAEIEKNIYLKMNRKTPRSEFRAWENSLIHMYKVLSDQEIPDNAGIAIEYNIPQTAKRVDFLISGYDEHDKGNVVIVELKQWDCLDVVEGKDALVETYTGNALRCVVHPSYQAWSYATMIEDYNQNVQQKNILLHPCSYLHNYRRQENDPLDHQQYAPYLKDAPAFTRGQTKDLRTFIKKAIHKGDWKENLYLIENGKIKPSKSLQNTIQNMLKGNDAFTLLDEQKVAYEQIYYHALKSKKDHQKRVMIVQGGPGTGKSVIAIHLLANLTNQDLFCQYVSKNSAPREVFMKKLKGDFKKSSIDNMFKGSGTYTQTPNNMIDTLIVDEAHRLNEKSGMYHNKGENQIKEIIHAATCSIFFLDESQRVTLNDIGSVDEIKKWAEEANAQVMMLELVSQFRCNGSNGYLAWIDHTLEIRETANTTLEDIDYDIRILDSPNEVRELIVEKNQTSSARMLAGYCWDWIKEGKNNSDVHDIQIGDFEMSWNLGNSIFALDESSIDEVGCIHTSQGLEFDYVGLIIGDDMRYEDGHIVTDFTKRASTDQSLKGIKKLYKEDPIKAVQLADEIIKNTYRTLMTRGMKGCYIYCTDKNLAQYLKSCL